MTKRRQQLLDKCIRIFSVLDQLDAIDDSDYDRHDTLRKCKRKTGAEGIVMFQSSPLSERRDQKCFTNWNPTKGLIDGQNPLEVLSNEQFVKTYRFSKDCVRDILDMISYGLSKFTNRGKPFSPVMQLLITLQFLTTGIPKLLLLCKEM